MNPSVRKPPMCYFGRTGKQGLESSFRCFRDSRFLLWKSILSFPSTIILAEPNSAIKTAVTHKLLLQD